MEKEDKIEGLYLEYEVLSASDTGGEKAYLSILSSAKGNHKEKILVAQFIPRFFHRFPNLSEEVIGAYLDLCEDQNISVRKEAIKGFPKFFEGKTNAYTKRFADILTQMLVATDQSEASLIRDSLTALLKANPKDTLQGILQQVMNGNDDTKGLALKFLGNRIRKMNSSWNKDVLDVLLHQVTECLKESVAEEVSILLGLLLSTGLGKTVSGRKQVLATMLTLLRKDDPRLPTFLRHATALLSISPELSSNEFFLFLTEAIPGRSRDSLILLKLLAQLAMYTKNLDNASDALDRLLPLLLDLLPAPETHNSSQTLDKLEFLSVECLLSTVQQMLKVAPDYFTKKQETLRDIRYRLIYFSKACNAYIRVIEETIKNNTREIDKIKFTAMKTLTNITSLIKDFFYNPPNPVTVITLSWLAVHRNIHLKRKSNVLNEKAIKMDKVQKLGSDEMKYTYKPPIGKYSQNLRCI